MEPDPLHAERWAFLDAAVAASNATQHLIHRVRYSPGSRDEKRALLKALRLVAEKLTDALASLDRFVLLGNELGLEQDATAELRRGRAGLSESLGIILREIGRAERDFIATVDR